MTDYYISTSHNTYLEANQLTGISSVDAYIQAIKKGFRCLELDCLVKNEFIVLFLNYLLIQI